MQTDQADPDRANALTSGHRACQGGGEALGARNVLDAAQRAAGGKVIAVNATGRLEVFSTPYPGTSWQLPWLHSLFGNAPAVAAGVAAALRTKGCTDVRVVGQGGDGDSVDIGPALSLGHVRARRRRPVRLLRQRGVHEYRRSALRSHSPGRAHGDHPGGRRGTRRLLRAGHEPAR
ncbi:hypothetical protein [Streptomyces sp. NBC_01092]|uniref:hypothetical protein n=1 Tax=Streptomyces sp. NBC_01092 TaxID=2903748 RepID=UPI003870D41A|nr:hypothetical protein OG254_04025 [Streptomyces sp. NBC_01092]